MNQLKLPPILQKNLKNFHVVNYRSTCTFKADNFDPWELLEIIVLKAPNK